MRSGSRPSGKSTLFSGKIGTAVAGAPDNSCLRSDKGSALQVPMAQHHLVLGGEALGELVRHVHRAVAPAGAADRDRERGALVEHELRQPALQEPLDVLDVELGL